MSTETPTADTPARRRLPRVHVPIGPVRSGLGNTAYVVEHNKKRLVVVLILFGILLAAMGARSVFDGTIGLIGLAPALAAQILFAMVYIAFYFGFMMWFLSRPRKYTVTPEDPQIGLSFENYRGQPDLLEHAQSTVRILQGIKEFELRGGDMPKGMLLSGLPGTGKTFLASCIASEAELPFVYIDASSLRGMFWGMDSMMVIKLFRDARGLARKYARKGQRGACIMFMDELDSIGAARSGMGGLGMGGFGMFGGGSGGLNSLLNQMDSLTNDVEDRWRYKLLRWFGLIRGPVRNKPVVFVIGATNRPQVLDPALVRPGRLDRTLEVYPPDAEGRKDIIEYYLNKVAHDPDIDIEFMVADSHRWTPIKIKVIINEALILAHDDGRERMTYKDWLAAADQRDMGLKQPIRRMLDQDRRALAYHEAGHAVVARYLKPEDRIMKASIIRSGDALGVVQTAERDERYTYHARQIEVDIMISLGSRAVEEEILDTKMTGASSDLMNASNRALSYCSIFGMGSSLLVQPPNAPMTFPLPVARMADELLTLLMAETKRLVREKEYAVHAVAAALLERGELIGTELEAVFEAADVANPKWADAFQRKIITLPRLFKGVVLEESNYAAQHQEPEAAAAAEGAAMGQPRIPGGSWTSGDGRSVTTRWSGTFGDWGSP